MERIENGFFDFAPTKNYRLPQAFNYIHIVAMIKTEFRHLI